MSGVKNKVDWSFGLGSSPGGDASETTRLKDPALEEGYYGGQDQELFAEEKGDTPWWKSQFFLRERVLFGTWDGVFTSCLVNLLGVIVFLRAGWVVGQAGVPLAAAVVMLSVLLVATSVVSAVGICERTRVESGGVYFLIAHVLGGQIGGAVGLVYCFGQAVGIALCATGFGESIAELVGLQASPWSEKGIGAGALLLLALINVAGVKWVIKLQFLLLLLVMLAVADFLAGSFVHHEDDGALKNAWANLSLNGRHEERYIMTPTGTSWYYETMTHDAYGVVLGLNGLAQCRRKLKEAPVRRIRDTGPGFLENILYLILILIYSDAIRNTRKYVYLVVTSIPAADVMVLQSMYQLLMSCQLTTSDFTPFGIDYISRKNRVTKHCCLADGYMHHKTPQLAIVIRLAIVILGKVHHKTPQLAIVIRMAKFIT
ncbi:unnamed protein product, partial [Meganyctiphanes norvegica]